MSKVAESNPQEMSSKAFGLSLMMATVQIMDGVLTGIGMHIFGIHLEGNLFLQSLMHEMGYIEALFIVKFFAILATIFLCYRSSKITWMPQAMEVIISFYLIIAVVPWSFVLLVFA